MPTHKHWRSFDEKIAWNNFSKSLISSEPFTKEAIIRVVDLAKKSGHEDREVGEEGEYIDNLTESKYCLLNIAESFGEDQLQELKPGITSLIRECREAYFNALENKKVPTMKN